MALDAANARIYGSDNDKVWVAPLGSTVPTALTAPTTPFVDLGWLGDDGIDLNPSDSVTKFRGHQGGRVVRTRMVTSETSFRFRCLESKKDVVDMWQNVTSANTVAGVTTRVISAGRLVVAKAFIVDTIDDTIHHRYIIPRGEIGERGTVAFKNSEITVWEFNVEVIGSYTEITNDPAFATT